MAESSLITNYLLAGEFWEWKSTHLQASKVEKHCSRGLAALTEGQLEITQIHPLIDLKNGLWSPVVEEGK